MDVADGIAGLSAPFAAGAAAGCVLSLSGLDMFIAAEISFTAVLFLLLLVIFPPKRGFRKALFPLYFFLGAFCFLSHKISCPFNGGSLCEKDFLLSLSGKAKSVIESIPYVSKENSALVKALLTGDRSSLGRETISVFRKSGASHILALSGLHLGIIYSMLLFLTAFMGKSPVAKAVRSAVITAFTWLYAVSTGASPSIIRAALFITFNEAAGLLHRKRRGGYVFFTALTVQLAVSPLSIESAGFQLSYLAMAGIIFIYPWLEKIYPESEEAAWKKRLDIPRRMWSSAALAISCQLTTFPVVLLRFGTFPKYFLITNLAVLPLASLVMGLSVAVVILTWAGICPELLTAADEKILNIFLWTLRTISEM